MTAWSAGIDPDPRSRLSQKKKKKALCGDVSNFLCIDWRDEKAHQQKGGNKHVTTSEQDAGAGITPEHTAVKMSKKFK